MAKEDGLSMSKFINTNISEIEHERIKGHPISRPSMKETTLCPICRYAVSDAWNYCPHCGAKLKPVEKEKHNDKTLDQ